MLEPGQIFASRYRIRRRIAEGGMGAIFEAEHTATERRVALKLLFPHIMSIGNVVEKFELEAKVSARVNCPHIVEVLDAGYDSVTQYPFLVMELLDGKTLAQRVDEQGPLPVDEALRVLGQVAIGLDAAHAYREPGGVDKPIVHRDLKPENLFLAHGRDGTVSVKILDYGIAKVLSGSASISQDVRGTPLFMAVEQITASELSPQTDVWAYGLIAYYALTGSHYWRSAGRSDASVHALFAEILSFPMGAPSARLREQNVSVELPAGFDAWLLRCIEREPARRFASAGRAFEALRELFEAAARAPAITAAVPKARSMLRTDAVAPARAARAGAAGGSLPAMATTQHRRSTQPEAAGAVSRRWALVGAAGSLVLGLFVWLSADGGGSEPDRAAAAPARAVGAPPRASVGEQALERRATPSIAPLRDERESRASEPWVARGSARDNVGIRPASERAASVRVAPIGDPTPAPASPTGPAAAVFPPLEGLAGATAPGESARDESARDESARDDDARDESARDETARSEGEPSELEGGASAPEKKRPQRARKSARPAAAPHAAAPSASAVSTKAPPTASEAYRVR